MLNLQYTNQFKKDFKLANKRGYNIEEFRTVLELLQNQQQIPEKYKDHQLSGPWNKHRELHITPDWLLIYRIKDSELILELSRTGTHSDLFGK